MADVYVAQHQAGTNFKTERTIIKVNSHRTPHNHGDWLA